VPKARNPGPLSIEGDVVRLSVTYKSPQALLSEFTRSVGKGGVSIASRKAVPVGTRFVFELKAKGVPDVVEVHGEVVGVKTPEPGLHLLTIKYEQPEKREGLDSLIHRIFEAHKYEKVRKHARIPIQLRAQDSAGGHYLVRDISQGGLGIEVLGLQLPQYIKVGEPFLLELTLTLGELGLYGQVVWAFQGSRTKDNRVVSPGFGVIFGKLRPDTMQRLDKILSLQALPPPPWKAGVSFGREAVARMP
jgi:Tfp pilus assembly protein PilZ